MLSKSKISLINSLNIKKYRDKHKLFFAEGEKIINEIIASGQKIKWLFTSETGDSYNTDKKNIEEVFEISEREMKKISQLKTPSKHLAVLEINENRQNIENLKNELIFAFEDLQNPGNLGSIIRICDWFGINNIILSKHSADIYSPKVIQATAGAFLRVNILYEDLQDFIVKYKETSRNICYGTFLKGENIYNSELTPEGLVVFGNEGQGISDTITKHIDKKLFIPSFSKSDTYSESLNIASATSIICSEFKRR